MDHDNEWSGAHADVLPTVLEALGRSGRDAARLILRRRDADGEWNSYWWTTGLYAAAVSLRLLARTSLASRCNDSRAWLLEAAQPRDAFTAALGWLALSQLAPDPDLRRAKGNLIDMLLETQRQDGLWPAGAGLCVPGFLCATPWESPNERRVFADSGLFTTATVLWALSERQVRSGAPPAGDD